MGRPARNEPKRRRRRIREQAAGLLAGLMLWLGPAGAWAAEPGFLDRLEQSWNERDIEAYLALWSGAAPQDLAAEREAVAGAFAADTLRLTVLRPDVDGALPAVVNAHAFVVDEPFGRAEHHAFRIGQRARGPVVVGRELMGQVEGFVHLTDRLDGFRADGQRLTLDDLEIEMSTGSIFLTPAPVGPTVLIFVGEGRVRMTPRPEAERDQLREAIGSRSLDEKVTEAFVRLHPDDLDRWVSGPQLVPEESAMRRLERARAAMKRWADAAFAVAGPLPGAPWWAIPPRGEAVAMFPTRHGELLLALTSHAEGVSLIDREARRQVCLYPAAHQPDPAEVDEAPEVDVLHHDLSVRYEPSSDEIDAVDTLHLRIVRPTGSLRLRLDPRLDVTSVEAAGGERLLSFRFGQQPLVVIPLGRLAQAAEQGLTLTIRYSGVVPPTTPAEDEIGGEDGLRVYTSRPLWYPQVEGTDYATASIDFDVPDRYTALSGGRLDGHEIAEGRARSRFVQEQPVRYLSLVVGAFRDGTARDAGTISLEGFGTRETAHEVADVLDRAARILTFYEGLFGPCPYQHLRFALAEAEAPGGHSPPGLVVLSRRSLLKQRVARRDPADFSDFPDFFLAHELAHQWWGHGVAPGSYRQRWLSEAVAQYAAALWVRSTQGEEAFRRVMERMERFALEYNETGPILLGRRIGHLRNEPEAFRAVVYDKGAYVLHMLRAVAGDRAFFKGLSDLQAQRRFGTADHLDLVAALGAHEPSRPVAPYVEEWLGTTRLPDLSWRARTQPDEEAGFRTTLVVEARGLPGPIPVTVDRELRGDAADETDVIWVDPEGGRWELPSPREPKRIRLNADRTILGHWDER